MNRKDKGMTILEVLIAFTILSIGIGFMLMSNKAYYTFRDERQERQQMIYYAAGQVEAYLEGQAVEYNNPPFDKYQAVPEVVAHPSNDYLEIVKMEVINESSPESEPVVIYTYKVKVP